MSIVAFKIMHLSLHLINGECSTLKYLTLINHGSLRGKCLGKDFSYTVVLCKIIPSIF